MMRDADKTNKPEGNMYTYMYMYISTTAWSVSPGAGTADV